MPGVFGIPDLVIAEVSREFSINHIVNSWAFEMKLSNWSRALMQAYRYKAFSDISFVLLDDTYISRALTNLNRFKRANVGLASINLQGDVTVHYQPYHQTPYCLQTRSAFERYLVEAVDGGMERDPLKGFTPMSKQSHVPQDKCQSWLMSDEAV